MINDQTYQKLVDRADGNLTAEELQRADALIAGDEQAAEEWKTISFTLNNIREAGIFEKVSSIRSTYESQSQPALQATAKVRSLTLTAKVMRIAAVLIVVLVSAAVIKLVSVNSSGVYNKYYDTYELNTVRSKSSVDKMETLYRERKWAELLTLSQGVNDKTNKEHFLTGIAKLETSNYDGAETEFKTILGKNAGSVDNHFADEAEYYLAMTYLAKGMKDQALPIFQSIKNDTQHTYYSVVNKMNLDLRILDIK